jgi:CubicO group peptidase (beta-lactamase class C family)
MTRRYIMLSLGYGLLAATTVTRTNRNLAENPTAPAASDLTVPATPAPQLTNADLDAFFHGVVPLQLAESDIAGAVVAVVKDGRLLFAKGYGYADVAKRRPVSPEDTLFRPGSISKLFTWTSVMQLVEQGKLNLDADVNEYLDFRVPRTFGRPVTMRNLMTHTPGFEEDRSMALWVQSGVRLTVESSAHLGSNHLYC